RDLRWIPHFLAVAAEHFRKLAERHIPQEVADVAPLLTVFRKLTVADLIHGGVVTDHRKIGDSKAVGGLHVKGCHSEGAVAVVAEDLLGRMRKARGDCESRAD